MSKKNETIAPDKKPQIYIKICEDGEICAWGLDQEHEELLLSLTGNHDLADQYKAMSFNLCG